ncbi:MAG: SIR2 family protein [Gammaproteobacteria bacterium]|nr:SIR2 family protein [Gammaproteobacteria bacterium]
MKIKTSLTGRRWLGDEDADEADEDGSKNRYTTSDEVSRVLSEVVTSRNLVVLAGLGTSLCVKNTSKPAPTMGRLWEAVKDEYAQALEKDASWDDLLRIAKQPEGCRDIEGLLSRAKLCEAFEEGENLTTIKEFIRRAEGTIRREVDFVSPGTELPLHEAFLRRLGRRSARRERLRLFTTNYDRCFEHAGQRAGFVVVDGFTFAQPSFFDPSLFAYDVVRRGGEADRPDYIESLFHLYKLHGSIDWEADQKSRRVVKKPDTDRPLLIYPRSSKYELAFEQPYLEMISSFQSVIRTRDTGLLIVGFGFNDSHIAEPVLAAIETNLSLKTTIVSPSLEDESIDNEYLKTISDFIEGGDARLALIEASFEDLVPSMPDVVAMTDLERHLERVDASRRVRRGTSDGSV